MTVDRGEGLVVKNPLLPYELNGRTESWIKVKPGEQTAQRACVF